MAQTGVKVNGDVFSRASCEIALVDGTIYDNIQAINGSHVLTPGKLKSKGRVVGRTRGEEEIGETTFTIPVKDFFDIIDKLNTIGGTSKGFKEVSFPISLTFFEEDEDEEVKIEFEGNRLMTDESSVEENSDASMVECTCDTMNVRYFKGSTELFPIR